ncbi:uncharacterized protein LOC8268641 [Ricinus communis]|uniref:Plastid division protein PDV1 n=1 Tax=Ricinus communis TaxID=3988 RepID=B9T336_RICCO|nr:uncharacterized protein LOC8268641 [Ricinus communis]EEF29728.1 conserved hypothetical protein [Ricinus communis]|eukprot:XP_002532655.1 uncharacterized protein LOC8268641 [Ricinus communis]
MELKGDLQVFIERAWALHDGLNDDIRNSNSSFCTFCSENGRFSNISQTSFQEKQRLIAIRDSLKDVGDVLMLLQKLQSWQLIDRHAALTRLEESRVILIERVKEYTGRPVDVVRELNSCFNNGNTAFDWSVNGTTKKRVADSNKEKKRRSGFMICGIRMLVDPRKWQKAFVVAAKLAVVSVSISSTVMLRHANRQQNCSPRVEPRKDTISSSSLDVFQGRG